MKRFFSKYRNIIISVALTAFIIVFVAVGTRQAGAGTGAEEKSALSRAVLRAVSQCYAIEGAYPSDVAYLEEHYGLQIDHDKYIVHYEAFAQNVPPSIKIVPKQ